MTLATALFTIGLVMAFGMVCNAQETICDLDGDHVRYSGTTVNGVPMIVFKELTDVPVEYARRLPNEVYFHWARAHNAMVLAAVKRSHDHSASVIQSIATYNGQAPATRGLTVRTAGGVSSGSSYNRTVFREVTQPTYHGPVTIYNPYFKGKN